MILGVFKRDAAGLLVSFELSGHAGAGVSGEDIVCAAVSALSFSTVNGIEALADFAPLVELDEKNEGYLYVALIDNLSQKQQFTSQILLENLLLALKTLQEDQSEFIQIKIISQGGADKC